ncbi:MAG: hypothetical protein Q7U82_16820 [Gammaproteobacteria bacterium]|nr:hypothetical protein [Gammaproteobacteria bacterium]
MSGITIKANSLGTISFEMGEGASVDQHCKPGKFYVYTHKDKDGTVFYVGKGTGDRAHTRERSPEWLEYLGTRSDGTFLVEIVRDGISEEDALEIEDAVMKTHGGTIINRVNPHAPYDSTKFRAYCEAQRRFKDALKSATNSLKCKEFENAIPEFEAAYSYHLEMARNANYNLGARNGLKSTAFVYHPTSALADGYSMVLAKTGRNRELIAFAERYFQDYEAPYNKAEDTLRNRMEKARGQL